TRTAVSPLGTLSSAQTTPPFPNPSSRMPRIASETQVAFGGRRSPHILRRPMISEPATIQRDAAIRNGGMVSRAILMARYVVPQIRHTATHARYARLRLWLIDSGFGIGDSGFAWHPRQARSTEHPAPESLTRNPERPNRGQLADRPPPLKLWGSTVALMERSLNIQASEGRDSSNDKLLSKRGRG